MDSDALLSIETPDVLRRPGGKSRSRNLHPSRTDDTVELDEFNDIEESEENEMEGVLRAKLSSRFAEQSFSSRLRTVPILRESNRGGDNSVKVEHTKSGNVLEKERMRTKTLRGSLGDDSTEVVVPVSPLVRSPKTPSLESPDWKRKRMSSGSRKDEQMDITFRSEKNSSSESRPEDIFAMSFNDLKNNFSEFRKASDSLVASLRSRIEELEGNSSQKSVSEKHFRDLEDQNMALNSEVLDLKCQLLDKDTELEELQNQIQEQASSLSLIHASKAVKPSRNSTTNSNDSSEKKLSFLETLMGCRVELDEEERFSCTLFNPANKREIRFQLNETEEGDYEYNPIQVRMDLNDECTFLRDDIYLDIDNCPILLEKILKSLHAL